MRDFADDELVSRSPSLLCALVQQHVARRVRVQTGGACERQLSGGVVFRRGRLQLTTDDDPRLAPDMADSSRHRFARRSGPKGASGSRAAPFRHPHGRRSRPATHECVTTHFAHTAMPNPIPTALRPNESQRMTAARGRGPCDYRSAAEGSALGGHTLLACNVQRHGLSDQRLQGGSVDLLALANVDGPPYVPIEAGVEEA